MLRGLAIAAGVLLLAACGGGDDHDDSAASSSTPESEISQEQIEAWANELWRRVGALVSTAEDFCPEDPAESPKVSIKVPDEPDIPKEAQPAVGRLVAEKIYEFCRSAGPSGSASISEEQIQQWAEQLIAAGGATVQCPSGTNTGVIQKPAVSVGFDAESDIPEEAQAAVAQRAGEMLRHACDPTPR